MLLHQGNGQHRSVHCSEVAKDIHVWARLKTRHPGRRFPQNKIPLVRYCLSSAWFAERFSKRLGHFFYRPIINSTSWPHLDSILDKSLVCFFSIISFYIFSRCDITVRMQLYNVFVLCSFVSSVLLLNAKTRHILSLSLVPLLKDMD